jgi:hypothetical protein
MLYLVSHGVMKVASMAEKALDCLYFRFHAFLKKNKLNIFTYFNFDGTANNITYPSLSGICAFIAVTLASFHLGDQNWEGGVLPPFYPGKINSSQEHSNSVIYS